MPPSRNACTETPGLLEQKTEKTGIRQDLEVVFDGNKKMVGAIMALAMFPSLTKFGFNRVECLTAHRQVSVRLSTLPASRPEAFAIRHEKA